MIKHGNTEIETGHENCTSALFVFGDSYICKGLYKYIITWHHNINKER